MYKNKSLFRSVTAFLILCCIVLMSAAPVTAQETEENRAEIIFTHDTHSHLESFLTEYEAIKQVMGGFARIKTVIEQKKAENSQLLVLDAGDFSMGTLYQTIFKEQAAELRMLGALGFDVTTLGNHEFDYRTDGLIGMINAAESSGDPLPELVLCNANLEGTPFEQLNLKPYTMVKKGNLNVAVIGVFGEDALACAPTCELTFRPAAEAVKETVAAVKENENADMIVCISHSGTSDNPKKSEDELLAKAVPELDVIVSGHSHTVLNEPINIGDTWIVSAGEYGRCIGDISLVKNDSGRWALENYELIHITDKIEENQEAKAKIDSFRSEINEIYLKQFGYTMDQVLTSNSWNFTPVNQIGKTLCEETLGNVISDSYIYTVKAAEGEEYEPIAAAVVPSGVIRETLMPGDITVADAYEISSLGIGPDKVAGYPLISIYLTGKELETSAEIDASVSPMMNTAELYWSGLEYKLNKHRIILNKVFDVSLRDEQGNVGKPEPDKLYRVVSDLYSGQMLNSVNDMSYGILSIVPKDKDGNPVTNFEDCIVYDSSREIKAWAAIAEYLDSFDTLPEKYQSPEGRKTISASFSPKELFTNLNMITLIVCAVVIILLVLLIIVIRAIIKAVGRSRKKPKGIKIKRTR